MSDLAERYEPYTTTVDPTDTTYDRLVLAKVEPAQDGSGWYVTSTKGWGIFVPNISGVPTPKAGDVLWNFGSIGQPVQGQILNNHVIWYRWPEQRAVHRATELARYAAEKRQRFERERETLDARYQALPEPFRARIDRFRAKDPDFRVDSEAYESFILQQAALLAAHFKTEDAVLAWERIGSKDGDPPYDHDRQMAEAPAGWSDGHSGNTYGCAVRFALALIRGESV
jgi:hypothetical protein